MRELLAHVQFRGTIRERSVEPFVRLLQALRTKRRVRGVLFDISSGGGAEIPSTDLYLAVKRLDAVKPVIASIGSLGASGAYMAAIGARKVYAYPDSGVGSIGVVFPHFAVRRLLEKVGIDVELLHEGRHKDAYQGIRPLTEEERAKLQAVTKDSYDSFVGMVARERKRPVADILPLATGEFWSGRKALELGLVDALGDREEALTELGRIAGVSPTKVVRVAPPRPFFERMFSGGMGSFVPGLASGMRDAVEDAVWDGLLYGR
ncbi:MAG TPA: signal peptide peptidase SppA [Thermoplasmata archaeon]|jgi:protease-4|nr:signal peptide peptidase SppA [Thermoplasmata archaeon]